MNEAVTPGAVLGRRDAFARVREHPWAALQVAIALLRGQYYRAKYRLLRRRVVIGKNFRVTGRLEIKGPGTVIFGDHCMIASSRRWPTTPYTHTAEAVIKLGDGVVLGSVRMGCRQRIEVGDGSIIAEAYVLDTDFHDLEPAGRHRWRTHGTAKPIVIGPNVWVAAGAWVLKGVTIGANSVVGAAAVVTGYVPPNVVVFGNPARVVWRLDGAVDAPRSADSGRPD